jgi:branched-chain amino acid aminotransferase
MTTLPETTYFVKNKYIDKDHAFIHVNDIGLLRGYAVFDYLKTYFGKPFHLSDHLARLQQSAELIGLEIPYEKNKIEEIGYELLKRNNFPESNLRIVVTGGVGRDSKTKGDPVLIVTCELRNEIDPELYNYGAKIKTVEGGRQLSLSKKCNYIMAIHYLDEFIQKGFTEVLYVLEGIVSECTSSNFFIIQGKKLVTPYSGILYGITRKVLMRICTSFMELEERMITLEEALKADEVFISSTEKEVMPVTMIDENVIADGRVGPMTKRIRDEFHNYVESKVWVEKQ